MRVDTEGGVVAPGVEAAAEQRDALAHPEESVPSLGALAARRGLRWVGNAQFQLVVAVGDRDLGRSAAVAGGVRERLLQDPVDGLVEPWGERSWPKRRSV